MPDDSCHILALNCGSTSVKFALYRLGRSEELVFTGLLDRIGTAASGFRCTTGRGDTLINRRLPLPDHETARETLFAWLREASPVSTPDAFGHRIVHGGADHRDPERITPQLLEALRELIPLARDHLPQEIDAIEAINDAFPGIPQVACFDTAFHRDMPDVAKYFALPRHLREQGVQRYGFHGISYAYIVEELQRTNAIAADDRIIIAHLGGGASMAALRGTRSIDTTMGMTPLGGLVMSQRPGDLDPGILLHLLKERHLELDELARMLNKSSGLQGVSETTTDMKELLDKQHTDPRAAEAVELFCYQARKYIGALTAGLGGLDTLVFTAGIGERSAAIRARICRGLEYLGIRIDPRRNEAHAPVISPDDAPVTVRVMQTREELMIARQTRALLAPAIGR